MNIFKKNISKPTVTRSISHPLLSESILETNFYNELQRNGWCRVVSDKPDNLIQYLNIKKSKINY